MDSAMLKLSDGTTHDGIMFASHTITPAVGAIITNLTVLMNALNPVHQSRIWGVEVDVQGCETVAAVKLPPRGSSSTRTQTDASDSPPVLVQL